MQQHCNSVAFIAQQIMQLYAKILYNAIVIKLLDAKAFQ